jgi:hypothetical protein
LGVLCVQPRSRRVNRRRSLRPGRP